MRKQGEDERSKREWKEEGMRNEGGCKEGGMRKEDGLLRKKEGSELMIKDLRSQICSGCSVTW